MLVGGTVSLIKDITLFRSTLPEPRHASAVQLLVSLYHLNNTPIYMKMEMS